MKNLLFALSVVTFVALGSALAQGNVSFQESGFEGDLLATELVGADIYTTVNTFEHDRFQVDALPADWERIATISDLVLGLDGQVRGFLVDVGGFLGLGARTVMVNTESVRIATHTNSNNVYAVINATREDLEVAPEYVAYDRTGMRQDGVAQPVTPVGETLPRVGIPSQPQEGFSTVAWSTLSVDDLRRAEVYDIENRRVSGISDILFSADGGVEAVLINVGGFLGIGQRSVAIPMDQIEIQGKQDLSDLRVYLAISKDMLEALPEHVGSN